MEDTREEIPVEMSPEQPFFDAIHENIDVSRVQPGKMRNAARACSEIAEAMVEEAVTNARQNNRRDMDEMRKAFDVEAGEAKAQIEKLVAQIEAENERANLLQAALEASNDMAVKAEETYGEASDSFVFEIGQLKARITEMEAEANEDRKIKKDMNTHIGEIQAKRDTTEEELKELRATHARLIVDNQKLWADNRELNSRVNSDKSHYDNSRRALCETIETLANVIRNS